MKKLEEVKRGDTVYRYLAGRIEMPLIVSDVTDSIIDCGWKFCRFTGAEIDEELGWGPPPLKTGSYILAERKQ